MHQYQTHLTGIRALAILLVVLYHLCPQFCPMGYHGCTVFFVLSGYLLISGFIHQRDEPTSFITFAQKKIARIFPLLSLVVLLTLLLGIYLYPPHIFLRAADTGFTALLAASNFYLEHWTGGYFAASVTENPLVHTWYLAITVQLYLAFYIGYHLLKRLPKSVSIAALILIGICSLLWDHQETISKLFKLQLSESTYYWTSARVWEMLTGCLVLCLPGNLNKKWTTSIVSISLTLVIILAFRFTRNPGFSDTWVAIATILLIKYAPSTYISYILNNKAIQGLGKISFSLYLWHWPIYALWCWQWGSPSTGGIAIILILSIVIATATYYSIERRKLSYSLIATLWGTVTVAAFTCSITKYSLHNEKFSSLYRQTEYTAARPYTGTNLRNDMPNFMPLPHRLDGKDRYLFLRSKKNKEALWQIGVNHKEPSFILIGDSHAEVLYPGFDIIASKNSLSGVYLHSYIMPFHGARIPVKIASMDCNRKRIEQLLDWLSRHPEITHVYIAQIWSGRIPQVSENWTGEEVPVEQRPQRFASALRDFCVQLKRINKNVILLTDAPCIKSATPFSDIVRHLMKPDSPLDSDMYVDTKTEWKKRNHEANSVLRIIENEGLATVLDISDSLFGENEVFHAYENGRLLMYDRDHLSTAGAEHFINILMSKYNFLQTSNNTN